MVQTQALILPQVLGGEAFPLDSPPAVGAGFIHGSLVVWWTLPSVGSGMFTQDLLLTGGELTFPTTGVCVDVCYFWSKRH